MKITGCFIGTQLRQLATHPDSTPVADAAVAHWHAVRVVLSPIIGLQGVAALFRRSMHLVRAEYPWLAATDTAQTPASDPLDPLRAVLLQQPGTAAASAQIALLQNFNDLLASLIGSSLTDRLLAPVWDAPSTGSDDAQDSIP